MSGNIGGLYQPDGIAAVAGDLAGLFAVGGLVAAIAVIAAVSICDGLIAMEMAAGAWFGRAMVGLIAGIVAGNLAGGVAGRSNPGRILMFCQPSGIAAAAGDTREGWGVVVSRWRGTMVGGVEMWRFTWDSFRCVVRADGNMIAVASCRCVLAIRVCAGNNRGWRYALIDYRTKV